MKLISLEEHWCPRELYEAPAIPGYQSIQAVKRMRSPQEFQKITAAISDLDPDRIALMDQNNVDMQIVSLCAANMELLDQPLAQHYARLANDLLLTRIQKYPERFRGWAALPTVNPITAAEELKRCMETGYFVGAMINGHINGHYLDEPQFEPLLTMAEKLDAPIYIHPAVPPQKVLDAYYQVADPYAKNVLISGGWGWHIETGTHLLRMVVTGVFDRHPQLKIIVGHLGEGIPFFMERLKNATGANLNHCYPYYLQNNVYYTISGFHDPDLFDFVYKKVGVNHLMFSADYPFNPLKQEITYFNSLSLPENERRIVAGLNATKLFKL